MLKIKYGIKEDRLKGGIADNMPDSNFDKAELAIGSAKEMEHTDDPEIAKEIAKDGLVQEPHMYTKEKQKDKEKSLSKYWKIRAKRRAKKAKRGYPNNKDKKWALEQQIKSEQINSHITNLFEKEITTTEEITQNVDEILRKIKEERQKIGNMQVVPWGGKKSSSTISVPMKPETRPGHGGVAKGYKKNVDKLKKKNKKSVGIPPGGSFGVGE